MTRRFVTWRSFLKVLGITSALSVLLHHIVLYESFPLNPEYTFPAGNIAVSILFTLLLYYSIDYIYYKYFARGCGLREFISFFWVAQVIFFVLYSLANALFIWIGGGEFIWYYLTQGLTISLLGTALGLLVIWGRKFKFRVKDSERQDSIFIETGNQLKKVSTEEIAYVFIQRKMVQVVLRDGQRFTSNVNLTAIEDKLEESWFYRINRQFLVSKNAVQTVRKAANQRLLVTVEPHLNQNIPLTVSRYKNKDFQNWMYRGH